MTDLFVRKPDSRTRARHAAPKPPSTLAKSAKHTLPVLLVGSIAMSLNLTSPVDVTPLKRDDKPKDSNEQLRNAVAAAMNSAANERAPSEMITTVSAGVLAQATTAPATYRVVSGDTVSAIAARFGLSTASVLALNGLGWKSLIFPGQVLTLTNTPVSPPVSAPPAVQPPTSATLTNYTITRGDTISAVASRFGVSTQSVLTANQLGWSTIIYPGQRIVIPVKAVPNTPPPAPTTPTPVTPPIVDLTPVVSTTPVADTPAPQPQHTIYLIRSGDTVTSIAAAFGVSIQAVLDANGVNRSSIIYAGRTLNIPGATTVPAGLGTPVTPLTTEMATNARTIIAVGSSLGVSDYGLVIALAAAMQESSLRNLNYGDLDSLGLFQQRPSTGWGTPAQVTDPVYASRLFFGGPNNPNKGYTRGLLDIPGWQSMSVTRAAQAVQISGHPNAYAKWEASARAWLSQLR